MDDEEDRYNDDGVASQGVSSILREGEELIENAAGAIAPDSLKGETNEMIPDLMKALNNEKTAPDLLPYEGELIAVLLNLLQEQRKHLDQMPVPERAQDDCVASLYEMDIARLRGMLANYHRIRAVKIHKWAPHIQANDEMKERLSPEEAQLHGAICKYREAYLNDIVLSQLPEGYNSLEGKGSEGPPDQVHVFARIQEDLGSIPSGRGDTLEPLNAGDSVATLYRTLAPYVLQKKVDLL